MRRFPLTSCNYIAYNKGMTPDDLKQWREKHGYTQSTLAQVLGVHVRTISKWERGVVETSPFLHLALEKLECKGVRRTKGTRKRKRR